MAITALPDNPSLEHLKKQAKRLLRAVQAGDNAALAQVGPYFGDPAKISLQQAQLVIARDHGFSSWTRLKRHIDSGLGQAETTEQRANRFLDLVCVHYGPEFRGPGEFEQAATLLAEHPEIAAYSLHTAAAAGDIDAVTHPLDDDRSAVDVLGGPFNWTPLMYAAYARLPGGSSFPTGKLLLDAGADPNFHYMWEGNYRFAVLTGIFGNGEGGLIRQPPHPDMVPFARAVLNAGANPNESQGAYNCCFSPDNTHLELMLEYGLKDSDPSDWWVTEPGDETKRKPVGHRTMHFQLIIALRWGFADRARLLIENGVDLNTPDNTTYPTYTASHTPYQVALLRGLPEIADLIKAKGGDAEPLPPHEQFQAACMAADLETARALAPEHMGKQPEVDQEMLREASGNNMIEAVRTMIALGFPLSPRGTRTALHAAAFKGNLEIMRLLIDAGADTTLRDPVYNAAPIGHAMHNHRDDAVAILADQPMDVFASAALGTPEQLAALLDEDPGLVHTRFHSVRTGDQESVDNDWASALWFAAVNGREDMARLLLDRGADPDLQDGDGKSIAEHAADQGHPEIAEFLR
ncbi:MAG: ankyrin repeat domain-containing protein, partial [Pseudomonadota bacterium]